MRDPGTQGDAAHLLVRKRIVRLRTGTVGRETFLPERRLCNGYFICSAAAALLHVWAPYPFPTPAAPFHTRVLYFFSACGAFAWTGSYFFGACGAFARTNPLFFQILRRLCMDGYLIFSTPAAPLLVRIHHLSGAYGAFACMGSSFSPAPAAPLHISIPHVGACSNLADIGSVAFRRPSEF